MKLPITPDEFQKDYSLHFNSLELNIIQRVDELLTLELQHLGIKPATLCFSPTSLYISFQSAEDLNLYRLVGSLKDGEQDIFKGIGTRYRKEIKLQTVADFYG